MIVRKIALAALALIATLLAACTEPIAHTDPAPARSSAYAAAVAAKASFLAALKRFRTTTYRFTVEGELPEKQSVRASGAYDAKGRRFTRTVVTTGGKSPQNYRLTIVGDDLYLRDDGDEQWVHVKAGTFDPKKAISVLDPADPAGMNAFAEAVSWVDVAGPGAFTGSFDPSDRVGFLPLGAPGMMALGGSAFFTATTDAAGNLASIVVTVKGSKKLTQTTRFSDVGKPVTVTKPKNAVSGQIF